MANLEPVEQFVKIKSCLDQKFIDNCPKFAAIPLNPSNDFEDPLEFLRFLCLITKPITDKLNENGQVRKSPLDCYLVRIRAHICAHYSNAQSATMNGQSSQKSNYQSIW